MKKIIASLLAFGLLCTTIPKATFADAVIGESIYTLGEDLKPEQKTALLQEMDYTDGEQVITVTNKEEHTYLGGIIPSAQIGSKAYSSSKITMREKKTGIVVVTENINWVTPEMYTNALITAGVKDAEVYVTAPFNVSGTAALTGLMKAYELSSGTKIDEETKKIANEEMVTTAKLGEELGEDKANSLVTNIKQEMAKEEPKNEAEVEEIVTDVANKMEVTLDAESMAKLTALFDKMNESNVNWDQVKEQIDIAKKEWGDKFEEMSQNFFERIYNMIKGFFERIWNAVIGVIEQIKDSVQTNEPTPETPVVPETEETPQTEEAPQSEEQPSLVPEDTGTEPTQDVEVVPPTEDTNVDEQQPSTPEIEETPQSEEQPPVDETTPESTNQ